MSCNLLKAEEFIKNNKHIVNDKYRLTYHVIPEIGWVNDPNGFSYYNGLYHLFYQYHPYGSFWGPMHWGHVTSNDLVHWKYEPVALAPEETYDQGGCFSGTALVEGDKHILMYTGLGIDKQGECNKYNQEQCIAIGDGIVYEKISKNPVICSDQLPSGLVKEDFRDPKIFKVEDVYYCIIGTKTSDQNSAIVLFKSFNLTEWQFISILDQSDEASGGVWECPDFFSMDGKDVVLISPQFKRPEEYKYYNIHSNCYRIGKIDLDLGKFQLEHMDEIDSGFDFYAPQTLLDAQGRRIMIAWMQMWERNMPSHQEKHHWAGAMTFPREIKLVGNQLIQQPVEEIEKYRKNKYQLDIQFCGRLAHDELKGNTIELLIEFENVSAKAYGIKLFVGEEEETVFEYRVDEEVMVFDRRKSGIELKGNKNELSSNGIRSVKLAAEDKKINMRFLIDRTSVEGFFNHGIRTMTGTIYASKESNGVELFSDGTVNVSLTKFDIITT